MIDPLMTQIFDWAASQGCDYWRKESTQNVKAYRACRAKLGHTNDELDEQIVAELIARELLEETPNVKIR